MGNMMPSLAHPTKQKKHPKLQKKSTIFMYSNMVKKLEVKNIHDHYVFLKKIGKGSNGPVYKAISNKTSNIRSIKVIQRSTYRKNDSALEMQFAIFKTLDHPNIVKMYQILSTTTHLYVVMELCEGQDLFDYVQRRKNISQEQVKGIIFQTISALSHMHENQFMHRDVKPQNIIYNAKTGIVKLTDLASASFFQSSKPEDRKRIGTSYYIAPEVLRRVYNQKCDSWSLGVTIYILLTQRPPFDGVDDFQVLKNVIQAPLVFPTAQWKNISVQAKTLISKLINRNIDQRMSISAAMQDPWFRSYLHMRSNKIEKNQALVSCLLNLKKFKEVKQASIRQGVLVFTINFISQNDSMQEIAKSFQTLDLNGDGKISRQQLKIGLERYLQVSQQDAIAMTHQIFLKIDLNNSQFIDYSQFLMAASELQIVITPQNLDTAFNCFDTNGDGVIDMNEFRSKLGSQISQQKYSQLLKQFDINGDGLISKQQFRVMMTSLLENSQ